MDKFSALPEYERERLAEMGFVLQLIQHAELMLGGVLMMVLPGEPIISLADLEAEEDGLRRRTLGQLLRVLRSRADVHPDMERNLLLFLEHRNEFVHRFSTSKKFDSENESGRQAAGEFLNQLFSEAFWVAQTFGSLISWWAERMNEVTDGKFGFPREMLERPEIKELLPRALATFHLIRRKLPGQ